MVSCHTFISLSISTVFFLIFPASIVFQQLFSTSWIPDENNSYPSGFDGIFSQVLTYTCPARGKRIIISNNIPDHDVTIWRNANPCEVLSVVEIPLDPPNPNPAATADEKTEVPIRGMIAMAKNGVPAFGPQESDGLNAVDPTVSNRLDAQYWYGHPGGNNGWHVHSPHMGVETIDSETFLGWSMDGFKIYGPLPNDVVDDPVDGLDMCNGRLDSEGNYRYHVRTTDQVDENAVYCDGDSPVTRWNYIFGCYSGDISQSQIVSQVGYDLPDDCVLESRGPCTDNPDYFLAGMESQNCAWVADDLDRCNLDNIMDECPKTCNNLSCVDNAVDDDTGDDTGDDNGDDTGDDNGTLPPLNPTKRPNVIIIQPDDLIFMDEWGRPPYSGASNDLPGGGDDIPHIEDLRARGLQMQQAYTASPMCGTSRYTTMTGKMPSRAASIHKRWDPLVDNYPPAVTIPSTKLMDDDCSAENLAAAFGADEDYDTAMIGKWHLTRIRDADYSYQHAVDEVTKCGFNHVGALYVENMEANEEDFNNFSDGTFSHNMEWLTYEAIKFINTTIDNDKNFFMYFNPTVPHGSMNVQKAIDEFSCQDTADPNQQWPENKDPWIKGMSEDGGCQEYRDTIAERANGDIYNLGPIWLDDAIGALVQALIDNGVYEDTIIVFQEDHGMDTKSALYEGGTRIPQFIHYPAGIHPGTFNAPVSTIDLAPTLFEYAGLGSPYQTDGTSWKEAIDDAVLEEDWRTNRCLFFEMDEDRAVRCGCFKYMNIQHADATLSGTWGTGGNKGMANAPGGMLFDLCAGDDDADAYATDPSNIREVSTVENEAKQTELFDILSCHLEHTDPREDAEYSPCYEASFNSDWSESPTVSPSQSPTEAPIACVDDDTFVFGQNNNRNCAWLSTRTGADLIEICNRMTQGDRDLVSDYCRATCMVC